MFRRPYQPEICSLLCFLSFSFVIASAQEFDGMVSDLPGLEGKPAHVIVFKGEPTEGTVGKLTLGQASLPTIQFLEINVRNRTRRIKPEQIKQIQIDGRNLIPQHYFPSGQWVMIDEALAMVEADRRLMNLKKTRRLSYTADEFEKLSSSNFEFAKAAVGKMGGTVQQLGPNEGNEVILISDFAAPQQRQLVRVLDTFIPKLNLIFGFDAEARVLPGKPIVAAFQSRQNLGLFQTKVVGNASFGTTRAFFHVVDEHVVVTAEDDRSPEHMTWQAVWGLAGAYSLYSYSDVELPAWVRVGLQQLCSDVMVPQAVDVAHERRMVLEELRTGSLNGILAAENLPGERQIVCKALMAHLYSLNKGAFGQMIGLLKMGRTTEEALKLSYGFDDALFAASFGRSLRINGLQP